MIQNRLMSNKRLCKLPAVFLTFICHVKLLSQVIGRNAVTKCKKTSAHKAESLVSIADAAIGPLWPQPFGQD